MHLRWPADHSDRDRHRCGATSGALEWGRRGRVEEGSTGCGVKCRTRILNGELWEVGGSVLRKVVNLQRVPALDLQLVGGLSAYAAPKASNCRSHRYDHDQNDHTTTTTVTTTTTTTTITIERRSVACVDSIPSFFHPDDDGLCPYSRGDILVAPGGLQGHCRGLIEESQWKKQNSSSWSVYHVYSVGPALNLQNDKYSIHPYHWVALFRADLSSHSRYSSLSFIDTRSAAHTPAISHACGKQ